MKACQKALLCLFVILGLISGRAAIAQDDQTTFVLSQSDALSLAEINHMIQQGTLAPFLNEAGLGAQLQAEFPNSNEVTVRIFVRKLLLPIPAYVAPFPAVRRDDQTWDEALAGEGNSGSGSGGSGSGGSGSGGSGGGGAGDGGGGGGTPGNGGGVWGGSGGGGCRSEFLDGEVIIICNRP